MKEIQEDITLPYRGFLCFDGEKLYFDNDEGDQLADDEYEYMVDTRGSL